ncbi:hypothetical protein RND71_035426 [Anisodus tanguticus]|uniref:Uncharacterized protein n=1 Tax=Anisodus tanguticus TaxID=243964 RepID=A0AAE1V268_9SOLA|nr:hypothetical protein RND71_035426 [Anisodus tanguticus]
MQAVRGQRFWKAEAAHAMLPPDVVKQVGRPKMKRNRELDEARKRKGEWSQFRKGTQMTCSNCGEPNHNARGEVYWEQFKLKERKKANDWQQFTIKNN